MSTIKFLIVKIQLLHMLLILEILRLYHSRWRSRAWEELRSTCKEVEKYFTPKSVILFHWQIFYFWWMQHKKKWFKRWNALDFHHGYVNELLHELVFLCNSHVSRLIRDAEAHNSHIASRLSYFRCEQSKAESTHLF